MDILGIGFPELILIFIIAMMIFGPRRLPEMAFKVGKFVRDLRNMSQGLLTEWQREITVAARLEELEKTRQEFSQIKNEIKEARQDVAAETALGVQALKETRRELDAVEKQARQIAPPVNPAGAASSNGSNAPTPAEAAPETGATPAIPAAPEPAPPTPPPAAPAAPEPAPPTPPPAAPAASEPVSPSPPPAAPASGVVNE
jgi:Tat protein translocase TatB subunit